MLDTEYLRSLRYKPKYAKEDQKMFGRIWKEHGTDIYKLIAKAHGETWDSEDEEKNEVGRFAKKTASILQREPTNNDYVVTTCESRPRKRQHQLQGKPEASVRVVEEDQSAEESERQEESC